MAKMASMKDKVKTRESNEGKCCYNKALSPNPRRKTALSVRETRCKIGAMMGVDDGFSEIPPVEKPKPTETSLLGHPINPPKHSQVSKCNIQVVVRDKRNQMHIFKGFNDHK
jgi:hypothetical protein